MSTTKNDGGPAFPASLTGKWAGSGSNATFAPDSTDGMSLRQWYAGMALQGMLCANAKMHEAVTDKNVDAIIAREAVLSADALIAELEKK